MSVGKFRITASQLQSRVHTAAKNSSNIVFVPRPEKRSIAGMMLFHEVLCCLREGTIVGKPKLTSEGYWEFRMERFAANRWFSIRVAAMVKGAHVEKLFALMEGR